MPAPIELSVSTWRQPMPPPARPARAAVLARVVELIDGLGAGRLRVAVDGLTAAGKTSLGHELARGLADRGRPVWRASLDDFKRPWSERHQYDRVSAEGYYRNAFDRDAARRLLLDPLDPSGDGRIALCSIDPLTQIDHSSVTTVVAADGILVVDGVFACRPDLDRSWDLRVWVDVDPGLSVRRGIARDTGREGAAEAEALHRDRYLGSELLYLAEVDPRALVEVIVDNTDLDRPRLVRPLP